MSSETNPTIPNPKKKKIKVKTNKEKIKELERRTLELEARLNINQKWWDNPIGPFKAITDAKKNGKLSVIWYYSIHDEVPHSWMREIILKGYKIECGIMISNTLSFSDKSARFISNRMLLVKDYLEDVYIGNGWKIYWI